MGRQKDAVTAGELTQLTVLTQKQRQTAQVTTEVRHVLPMKTLQLWKLTTVKR